MSIKVTDNKEVKETVLAGLKHNKEKYGKKYCPCSILKLKAENYDITA